MKSFKCHKNLLMSSALVGLLAIATGSAAQAADPTYRFDIPAESLSQALTDFSQASSQQIIYSEDLVRGRKSAGLHGTFTAEQALDALLAGTDLKLETNAAGVMMVRPKNVQAASNEEAAPIEEVVVTGTLIPGSIPASPVTTITQADIANSGYATVSDVLKSMPEFYAGGQNVGVITSPVPTDGNNFGYQSSANLRGLGSDATLTLIDGHRISYGGINNSVDLGIIPTAAIDRVEVLTDGASALYGSDAVAGVVNVKLRDDFNGAEASFRIGTTSDGGGDQRQTNLLGGYSWSSGNIVAGYENVSLGAIKSSDRSYSSEAATPTDLIPQQLRNSYFLDANQSLSSNVRFFVQGLYSAQSTQDVLTDPFPPVDYNEFTEAHVSEYSTTAGIDVGLPADWTSEISIGMSGNKTADTFLQSLNGVPQPSDTYGFTFRNSVFDVSGTATGSLFALPSGDVKLAIGADYRHEKISVDYENVYSHSRNVEDVYGELQVPLVSPDTSRAGLERLDVSASGRFENYSDFGSSTTPKFGLVYEPLDDLRLRATWGKSFRAPSLNEAYGDTLGVLYPSANIGSDYPSPGNVLLLVGSNPNLQPETSKNWTAGFDYTPDQIPGLSFNLTAYGIQYEDRIAYPFGGGYTGTYNSPVYASYITKDPTAAQLQAAESGLTALLDETGGSTAPYVAIIDDDVQNAQSQSVHGVDLSARYHLESSMGNFDFSGSGSWLHIEQKNTATSPSTVLTGYIYYPAKFRSRDGLSWSNDSGLSASGFLNYQSGEINNFANAFGIGSTPVARLGAWVTVDAQVAYAFRQPGFLNGLKLALAATNLFDQAPPRLPADSTYPEGIGYDATNTNPYGRLVSLTLTKDW